MKNAKLSNLITIIIMQVLIVQTLEYLNPYYFSGLGASKNFGGPTFCYDVAFFI